MTVPIDGTDGAIFAMAADASRLFVAGHFTRMGAAPRNNLAAIDTATGKVTAWDPDVRGSDGLASSASASLLALAGARVFVAGSFTRIGAVEAPGLAVIDATTGAATPWNVQLAGPVQAMASSGSRLYVAGSNLTAVNGQPRPGMAAFDVATGALTDWVPQITGGGSVVNASHIVCANGAVVLGGYFPDPGGRGEQMVVAVDAASGALLPWNPRVTTLGRRGITAMAASGNVLYVAGYFDHVGGQPRMGWAAVDLLSGAVLPWPADGFIPPVNIAAAGDKVCCVPPYDGLYPFNPTALAYDASQRKAIAVFHSNGPVGRVCATPSDLYLSGGFTTIEGQPAEHLARYRF